MITASEAGLSQADWEFLRDNYGAGGVGGDVVYRLMLEQYAPSFSQHDTVGGRTASTCFDAVVSADWLVRAMAGTLSDIDIDRLSTEDEDDQEWETQGLEAASLDTSVSLSLATNGNALRLFWYDGTNLKYFDSEDNGETWGAAQTVGALANVEAIAATSPKCLHVLYKTTTKENHRLAVYTYDGSWTKADSHIRWPLPVGTMDAIGLDEAGKWVEVEDETGASWGAAYHGLCLADGTAFFRAEGVDLSWFAGHKIVLADSVGKEAVGYIQEADDEESLGDEECLNPGFEDTGDDVFADWIELKAGGSTINDEVVDVHSGSHACRLDIDASNSNALVRQDWAVTEGSLRRLAVWFKSTGGATGVIHFYDVTHAATIRALTLAAAGAYTERVYYITVPAGCETLRVDLQRGSAASKSLYYDDVSLKVVEDVGTDGVHVVDELGGSTRNWESIESGFDYNDDSYTFTVYEPKRKDIIALAADLPPLIGRQLVGTTLAWKIERVCALVLFAYQNGRWSDHYPFDVVDKFSARSRQYPVLSSYGDLLFMTYQRREGVYNEHTCTVTARSKDGICWELPAPMTDDLGNKSKLLKRGNHLYLLDSATTLRSFAVAFNGEVVSDETDEDISAYPLSIGSSIVQTRSTEILLSNPSDVLRGAGRLLGGDYALQARLSLGYEDEGTPVLAQVALAHVAQAERDLQVPTDRLNLSLMDPLALLGIISVEGAHEWPSQQLAGDNFHDPTGTGYGGMGHTAVQSGGWETTGDTLLMRSSNSEGVCWDTHASSVFCGEKAIGIRLHYADKDEYAGVAFWGLDKDYMWYAAYHPDEDTLYLYERQAGADTLRGSYGSLGWSVDTYYYIRVRMNYAQVVVYTSTDGKSWTQRIDYERETITALDMLGWEQLPLTQGWCGRIAYGYTPTPTYSYGTPPVVLPSSPVPVSAVAWAGKKIARTNNLEEAFPVWEEINYEVGDKHIFWVARDTYRGGLWAAAALHSGGYGAYIYYMDDDEEGTSWELKHEFDADPYPVVGQIIPGADGSLVAVASAFVYSFRGMWLLSSPDGDNWTERNCDLLFYGHSYPYMDPGLQLAWDGDDTAWINVYANGAGHMIKTLDLGQNWDSVACSSAAVNTGVIRQGSTLYYEAGSSPYGYGPQVYQMDDDLTDEAVYSQHSAYYRLALMNGVPIVASGSNSRGYMWGSRASCLDVCVAALYFYKTDQAIDEVAFALIDYQGPTSYNLLADKSGNLHSIFGAKGDIAVPTGYIWAEANKDYRYGIEVWEREL